MSALATILRRSAASAAPFARRFTATRAIVTPALFSSLNGSSPSAFTGETRHFCTAVKVSKPSSDESLLRVIEDEIKCAAELEGQEVLEAPANFPFEIQDNPGLQTISLTREYEGELIKVEVHVSNLITGDEDDDNDDGEIEKGNESSVPLVVRVSKKSGGVCLEFGCTAFPDEIAIDSLTIKNPESHDDQIPYEGPDFNDLDENLQKAFMKYLEIRGIKPSTTNFLHEYMLNKDSREYLVWLKNVKNFIQK